MRRRAENQSHLPGSKAACLAAWMTGCLFALGILASGSAAFAGDASNEEATIAPVDVTSDAPATPQASLDNPIVPMMSQSFAAATDSSVYPTDPAAKPKLFGLIAPSDESFGDFISPDLESHLLRGSADVDRGEVHFPEPSTAQLGGGQ